MSGAVLTGLLFWHARAARSADGREATESVGPQGALLGTATSTKPIRFQVLSDKLHFNLPVYAPV